MKTYSVKYSKHRTNTVSVHLCEIPRIVKFADTESRIKVPRGCD